LLYPINCYWEGPCQCDELRARIILTLNVEFYNGAIEKGEDSEQLYAIKSLLKIPEEIYFRKNWGNAYPLWLINQELENKDQLFKIVDRLVWSLLRLAKTYEESEIGEPRASVNEAVEMILGKTPLKSKQSQEQDYLCGEKAYGKYFKEYKSVCHFIAAAEILKREKQRDEDSFFVIKNPEQIERFLSIAHWFRKKLLSIKTPNVKTKSLFSEELLLSFSSWVNNEEVDIDIEDFDDKRQELKVLNIGDF